MNYRDAKKIKIGDVVVDHCGHRHKVRVVNDIAMDKRVSVQFEDSDVIYAHTTIHSIEPPDKKHEKYYMVLTFNHPEDVDETCHSHIYPSYVSCMSVKGGLSNPFSYSEIVGKPLMLQCNPHDSLKFVDEYNARKVVELAKKIFPQKEFEIIEMSALFFGRIRPRWVVDL